MARTRKAKVRTRDYAAEYRRRQARARALGYGNYYARRVRAGAPPSTAKPSGEALRRRRGHAGAGDLRRELKQGALVQVQSTVRDPKTGRLKRVEILVIEPDGSERTYTLQGPTLTQKRLDRLSAEIDRGGGVVSPLYPIRGLEAKAA